MKKLDAIALILLGSACASAPKVAEPSSGLSMTGRFLERQHAIDAMKRNFARVHFEFDSAQITSDTRDALVANVEIMQRYPELWIEVEGHCDESGSTEYNLQLGQRRAEAILKYMTTAGVAEGRVQTISYGEERPVEHTGAELAVNRRAEFRIEIDPSASIEGSVASRDRKGEAALAQK